MKIKPPYIGYFFIVLGVIFIILENIFYQFIDKNGILHESLFLPLGVLFFIVGFLLLLLILIKKISIKN